MTRSRVCVGGHDDLLHRNSAHLARRTLLFSLHAAASCEPPTLQLRFERTPACAKRHAAPVPRSR
eukprot:scaffold107723_cov57-Phaeocystis_antarctica.AAC.4